MLILDGYSEHRHSSGTACSKRDVGLTGEFVILREAFFGFLCAWSLLAIPHSADSVRNDNGF